MGVRPVSSSRMTPCDEVEANEQTEFEPEQTELALLRH